MIADRLGAILREGVSPAKAGALMTLQDTTELGTKGSITCTAGKYTVVGSYEILPQQKAEPGYGSEGELARNVGMLYVKLYEASVQKHGKIRVQVVDNQGRPKGYYLHSVRTEKLDDSESSRTEGFIVPIKGIVGSPYDMIEILFLPDATTIVDGNENDDGSTIRLDATLYS